MNLPDFAAQPIKDAGDEALAVGKQLMTAGTAGFPALLTAALEAATGYDIVVRISLEKKTP